MINTRRKFIKNLAVGFIGGNVLSSLPSNVLAKSSQKGIELDKGYTVFNEQTQKNMIALCEALLPGSQDINIGNKVMNNLNKDLGAAAHLDAGFWNLEALSRSRYSKSFYELKNQEDINKLIKYIKVKNRLFYNNFRNLIFKIYYSDPVVWKKLSYSGPPQPKGFMDYSEPPKK